MVDGSLSDSNFICLSKKRVACSDVPVQTFCLCDWLQSFVDFFRRTYSSLPQDEGSPKDPDPVLVDFFNGLGDGSSDPFYKTGFV